MFLLTLLNIFHYFILLSSNRTTIEFCDPSEESSPYDQGTFKNFQVVLGKNPLIWLFPLKVQIDSSMVNYYIPNSIEIKMIRRGLYFMSYTDKNCLDVCDSMNGTGKYSYLDEDVDELSPLKRSDIFINMEYDYASKCLTH